MTLANMYEQGVHHLIAFCLNDACRNQALMDVSRYPDDLRFRRSSAPSAAASTLTSRPKFNL
jgi:hypothetical protein